MNRVPSVRVRNMQRKLRVDARELTSFAHRALSVVLGTKPRRGDVLRSLQKIDVLLVSDRRSAELHQQFMNIAGPTDVITFQHGEIFVSTETARANARRFRTTTEAEIRLYIVHGLLHLAGFDDTSPSAAQLMAKTQEQVIAAAKATA